MIGRVDQFCHLVSWVALKVYLEVEVEVEDSQWVLDMRIELAPTIQKKVPNMLLKGKLPQWTLDLIRRVKSKFYNEY